MATKVMKRRVQRKMTRGPMVCLFCTEKTTPSYKDIAVLDRFMTDRGRIVAQSRSGVCRQHQRQLTLAIKRARHLAFLPFVPGA